MHDKITVRLPNELRQAIARFRQERSGSFNSTQAACRHIIEDWLAGHGYIAPKPPAVKDDTWQDGGI